MESPKGDALVEAAWPIGDTLDEAWPNGDVFDWPKGEVLVEAA